MTRLGVKLVICASAVAVACSSDPLPAAMNSPINGVAGMTSPPPPAQVAGSSAVAGRSSVPSGVAGTIGAPGAAGRVAAAGSGSVAGAGVAGALSAGAGGMGLAAGGGAVGMLAAGAGGGSAGMGASGAGGMGTSGAGGKGASGAGGMATAGASGAHAGAGGAAGSPPFMATGEPITGTQRAWTWVPFPNTKCRDGSPAGISVNLNSQSDKLVLALEGGGACFDQGTCEALVSPANIPLTSRTPDNAGIFDRNNNENPVADWNLIYVPYCTGDVFIGDNDEGKVDGVSGTQHFVGRPNMTAFLNRIIPTFKNLKQVLLTGRSAGGFGAFWNGEFVQKAFGSVPVTVIDDSGPPFSTKFAPECLSNLQRAAWRLERTVLAECGDPCKGPDIQGENLGQLLMKDPAPTIALIESDADAVIRGFYGVGVNFGQNDCKGSLDIINPGMTAMSFQAALRDYRSKVQSVPSFSTFFIENSDQHMWILDNSFYGLTARSGGVRLVDWFKGVLEGKPGTHLGLK